MSDLIIFETYTSRLEAEVVKGRLETDGIKCVISADDQGGMSPYPMSPSPQGVQLLVNEKDIIKAKEVINNT